MDILNNGYIVSLGILIGFILLSLIVKFFLKRILFALTKRTKTDFDDLIIQALFPPIFYGTLFAGILIAAFYLPILASYKVFINKIGFVIITLLVMWSLIRLSKKIFVWFVDFKKGKDRQESVKFGSIFKKLLNILIYVITGIIILKYFGVEVTPLLATLGVGGLAVALALQDTLANFFSGFYIITDKSVRIGELVELEGGKVKGHVADIGWRTSKIKTWDGNIIVIPNSKLAQTTTTNYDSVSKRMSVSIPLAVSYNADLEKVEKICIGVAKKVAKKVKGTVENYVPVVRFNEFADSSINFKIIMKVEQSSAQYPLKHEFIKALHAEFKKKKIEIPYPQMDVHMKKK